jgi:cytoskeletal protein RodZ
MDKNKRKQLIIMGVLLLVLGGVFYWQFLRPNPVRQQTQQNFEANPGVEQLANQPRPAGNRSSAPPPAVVAGDDTGGIGTPGIDLVELVSRVQNVDFNYDVALRERPRNPMTPLVGLTRPTAAGEESSPEDDAGEPGVTDFTVMRIASNMVVTGIMYDENRPMAVIDNEVVHPGYTFPSGVVVDTIEPERVLLRINESVVPVELEER